MLYHNNKNMIVWSTITIYKRIVLCLSWLRGRRAQRRLDPRSESRLRVQRLLAEAADLGGGSVQPNTSMLLLSCVAQVELDL